MAPGSFLLGMLNRSKEQGELVAETETRSAVFVARRPSVRARMASCPFDDPPSWWMVKKCVPDQKIVIRWEGDGEEAYEVPLPVEVQSFLAMVCNRSSMRAVLPSARICPYFYGKSTCNPQYGNAVVDSANLKKSKPISKSFNLKQISVSN